MALFKREVEIDFNEIDTKEFTLWCESMDLKPEQIDDLTVEVEVEVAITDFDDDEIITRYGEIMGGDRIERAYRYLAEGDVDAAMDELQREFGLAPPSHERAIADLLAGARG